MNVTLEFSGGAELLFDKVKPFSILLHLNIFWPQKKTYEVTLPTQPDKWTLQLLLFWMRDNLLKERPELFLKDNSVRPGILVLVNDSDWELLGQLEYELEEGDNIVFISTLHGG